MPLTTTLTTQAISNNITYYLADHPTITNFRWSPTESWGATWSFLISSILLYLLSTLTLHLLLSVLRVRPNTLPLGPVPALHSLATATASSIIFVGILLSSVAEIHDTRWLWRRTRTTTAFHWLLCFPLGTRASGRVFFWSYAFYLSRFLNLFRTFITIVKDRKLNAFSLLNQSILLCTSFLWLEFSQSFQVLAILFTTLLQAVVYGNRFLMAAGWIPGRSWPVIANFQVVVLCCNLVCNVGVFVLHFCSSGGCNGIVAWGFNSVLNGIVFMLVFRFLLRNALSQDKKEERRHDTSYQVS